MIARIRKGKHIITSHPAIKYLEVMINARLNFKELLHHVCIKVTNVSVALARMIL